MGRKRGPRKPKARRQFISSCRAGKGRRRNFFLKGPAGGNRRKESRELAVLPGKWSSLDGEGKGEQNHVPEDRQYTGTFQVQRKASCPNHLRESEGGNRFESPYKRRTLQRFSGKEEASSELSLVSGKRGKKRRGPGIFGKGECGKVPHHAPKKG